MRHRQLIVIETPSDLDTAVNDYGDPVVTWNAVEVLGTIYPVTATEQEVDRETRTTEYVVLLPIGVEVDARCWLRWESPEDTEHTARILGEPQIHTGPRGPHHQELRAQEIASESPPSDTAASSAPATGWDAGWGD